MKFKTLRNSIIACLLFTFAGATQIFAQADALVDTLQKKGLLTQREANEVREQMFKDAREQFPGMKIKVGSWLDEMKLYGDMRLRYEQFWDRQGVTAGNGGLLGTFEQQDRTRYRFRLRAGMVATAGDWEAGFRLASGDGSGATSDSISTNTTFDGFGSKKNINIDLAYLKYMASFIKHGELSLMGGKMENPFWETDMVYDPDLTPEGFAEQYKFKVNDAYSLFANLSQWALAEENTTGIGSPSTVGQDRYMMGYQVGHEWKIAPKKIELKQAVGYYDYVNLRGQASATDTGSLPVLNNANAVRNGTVVFEDEFNVLAINNELKLGYWEKYPIRLQGEYINNLGQTFSGLDAYLNEGYKVGAILGEAKKKGQWQIGYWYERLEANATFSGFSDSDFGGGGTNNKGHIVKAAYMLTDWASLGLAYFNVQPITDIVNSGTTASTLQLNQRGNSTQRFQFDVIMKF